MAEQRLQKELKNITKNPLPHIRALPSPTNLLEWHYVLEGDSDSPYKGGFYHGKIIFPSSYPYKPPSIMMITPSGRFETNARLCLSISDFHPESWNPLWGICPILLGLQSFFYEDTMTMGSLKGVSDAEKKRLAASSLEWNVKNSIMFRKLFPELVERFHSQQAHQEGAVQADEPDVIESEPATQSKSSNIESTLAIVIIGLLAMLIARILLQN
mmetsp:Transcript_4098/g.8273  ORF Transcript_4098/g.8273 Transcript_4098/m.8273 type:complete len:214 (+) Transcript_4098:80-721(+)